MKTLSHEARELELYITNDGDLYRQQLRPIHVNLSRKHKKRVYNHALAPKLFRYFVDNGAKKYLREFCEPCKGFGIFTPAIREEVAQVMADDYLKELKLRNYTE